MMFGTFLCRLEAYDRNQNFENTCIILPDAEETDWPTSGFKSLEGASQTQMPKVHASHIKVGISHNVSIIWLFLQNVFLSVNVKTVPRVWYSTLQLK